MLAAVCTALGIVLALMAPLAPSAGAQTPAATGSIVGTVTDSSTTNPVTGASVALEGGRFGAPTGSDGRYRLGNVPAGTYTLRARRRGY